MTIIDDEFQWSDTREELSERFSMKPELIKTFTFISSSVEDNKILLKNNPSYLASLNALGMVDKGRLLYGNWLIKNSEGLFFKRNQVQIVNSIPCKIKRLCRAWDLAATVPTPNNSSPDATAGMLMAKLEDGRCIILDVIHGRWSASDVRKIILKTAQQDKAKYGRVVILIPADPGQAGKAQSQDYIKYLSGFIVKSKRVTGDKQTRAEPFATQWQNGNILLLNGDYIQGLLMEYEAFPDGRHDDRVDVGSDSFLELQTGRSWAGLIS